MEKHKQRRALCYESPPDIINDEELIAEILSRFVQIPTVSLHQTNENHDQLRQLFDDCKGFLKSAFPSVYSALKIHDVGNSILLEWKGVDTTLKPGLLSSHMDVVPAGRYDEWKFLPFSGKISEGFVWGRGTLDCKQNVITTHAAISTLLLRRPTFLPKRRMFFAFTCDEEIGGLNGSRTISQYLHSLLGEEESLAGNDTPLLAFVLDEGMPITLDAIPHFSRPLALIGVAEKGSYRLKIGMRVTPHHTGLGESLQNSSVGRISRAVIRILENPFPIHTESYLGLAGTLKTVAKDMHWSLRYSLGWLANSGFVVSQAASGSDAAAATTRTSIACTRIISEGSGNGDLSPSNVSPASTTAIFDIRAFPGDSASFILSHIKAAIDDPEIQIELTPRGVVGEAKEDEEIVSRGYNHISKMDSMLGKVVADVYHEIYPESLLAPNVLTGGTDSFHYSSLSDTIFRHSPQVLSVKSDIGRIHGVNERISFENLSLSRKFYIAFVEKCSSS